MVGLGEIKLVGRLVGRALRLTDARADAGIAPVTSGDAGSPRHMAKSKTSNPNPGGPSFQAPHFRPIWSVAIICLLLGLWLTVAYVDYQPDQTGFLTKNTTATTEKNLVGRLGADVAHLSFIWFGWAAWHQGHARLTLSLLVLTLWQFVSGLTNVVLDWPLVAAVAHTAGAAGFVIVLAGAWAEQHMHGRRVSLFAR